MKKFIFVLTLIVVLSSVSLGFEYPSQFQGFSAINRTLQDRLFSNDEPNPFSLGRYLGGNNLGALMGQYQGNGLNSGFFNGQPNATNMLLWFIAFDGLSKDLAKICLPAEATPTPVASPGVPGTPVVPGPSNAVKLLNESYKPNLLALCAWPSPDSRNEMALKNIWISTMSYDAPDTEYNAWKDFMLSAKFENATASSVIETALKTLFLNPYFLLRP